MQKMTGVWDLYKNIRFVIAQPLSTALSFAVVTAHNPRGERQSDSHNRYLDYRLQQDMQALNAPYRSLWGCAPDYSHQEKSWAIVAEKGLMIALAQRYEQNAIYWVEQDQLYLTPCLMREYEEEHLGAFSTRVRVAAEMLWE